MHDSWISYLIVLGVSLAICLNAQIVYAQSTELTSHDNHALLYAHQLQFSSSGTPMVRIRIADNMETLRFKPKGHFRVYPSGKGGCAIDLPGNQNYEISFDQVTSGKYQYASILARSENVTEIEKLKNQCLEHQVDVEVLPIGSLFALHGKVFDNRENLLITKRSQQQSEQLISLQSCGTFASSEIEPVPNEPYSELLAYPEAGLTIRDSSKKIQIHHRNLMWIELSDEGAVFYDIPGENGKTSDILINSMVVVTPDKNGKMAVVQSADVETILRGIVPGEIFASAPESALMAQTIAARTTLIAQVGNRHQADPYHLCNHQHCQVYLGLSGADPRTDKAIEKTRGQILFYGKKTVQGYYSSHCGGFSAGRNETWGLPDQPYLQALSDNEHEKAHHFNSDEAFLAWWQTKPDEDYCGNAPKGKTSFSSTKYARWMTHVHSGELNSLIHKAGYDVGKVTRIEVSERGPSFRAIQLKISGTKGEILVDRELSIRKLLNLKSALFVLKVNKANDEISSIDIYGAGFGHGVGLCQTGAIGMAQRGKSVSDILNHYFPGTHIETLW